MPTMPARPRLRASATRLRLAAGMTTLVAICLAIVFLGVRANLLTEVTEEANIHVETEISEFAAYAGTAEDPLTGRPYQSGPRLVEAYLSQHVPAPEDALAAAVDGHIIQLPGAGRRIPDGSPLAGEILSSPANSGVAHEPEGGSVHWGRVEVSGSEDPVIFLAARWTDTARERADAQLTTHAVLAVLTAGAAGVLSWFLAGVLIRGRTP